MATLRLGFVFLLIVFFAACATAGAGRAPIRGIVVFDSEGVLALDIQGQQMGVRGVASQVAQLERIPDAYVAIRGNVAGSSVVVRSFEILDAGDGLQPMVGNLIIDQSGVMLSDEVTGTRLALRGSVLAELKVLHGARIWVTGTVVGPSVILVAHWGVLAGPRSR